MVVSATAFQWVTKKWCLGVYFMDVEEMFEALAIYFTNLDGAK